VAFAPLDAPTIAVAVIVENGGGSSAAYPIART
jgi:penicillin-binding protein 2